MEEVHAILRQIVARTIESEECKGLAQFTHLKREIATTAASSLESMKVCASKYLKRIDFVILQNCEIGLGQPLGGNYWALQNRCVSTGLIQTHAWC